METYTIVSTIIFFLIILYALSNQSIKSLDPEKKEAFWKAANATNKLKVKYPEWEYESPVDMKKNLEFQKVFTEYVIARLEYHILIKLPIDESLIDQFLRFSIEDSVIEKCTEYFEKKEKDEALKGM